MKIKTILMFAVLFLLAPEARPQETYTREKQWEKDIAAFLDIDKRQTPPSDAVLFTGSSSIRMWMSLREDFPHLRVINRGFGGSNLEDLVFFAPKIVKPYKPKKIVVYSGENDIEAGQSAENVLADFKAFLAFRDRHLARTPVVYVSMKPSLLRWKIWPEMLKGNELIKAEIRSHQNVKFADLAARMLGPDGKPLPDIFLADGLHMNAKGYAIWREHLAPFLK